MVAAVAYLLVMLAGFVGLLPVLVWLFGEARDGIRFQNDYEKKEEHEMLMFSGLETQSEISQLLDEIHGSPSRTFLSEGVCEHRPSWGDDECPRETQVRARAEEHRLFIAKCREARVPTGSGDLLDRWVAHRPAS